ncbi:tetratricopeptide repeat protein 37-like [Acropora millepora]|uniref:tetratricopeptide repeat protein 37-like n=1 Tax=Acropora millepora TaxID=45264 RepID=UPI001CF3BD65|nr:tetratricopeptide repeat protein 37-like [Acropora millepora]
MAASAKETKALLKNARECIKNKEYKESLKHCKGVLKLDKTNYTALVFIGKCAAELDQADQSLMAYRKAIESDETQPLAWQGLAALCEKEDNSKLKSELLEVYPKLLQFHKGDKSKWVEVARKLAILNESQGNAFQAVAGWEEIVALTEDKTEQFNIWSRVIQILEKVQSPEKEERNRKLKEIYKKVVTCEGLPEELNNQLERHFECYVKLLSKLLASENQELLKEQPTETIDTAKSMIQLFPRSKFALEFLAKDFLLSLVNAPTMEMTELFQKLCHMYPESGIGAIGLGSVILHQNEFVVARELLQKGLQIFSDCPYGWLSLCRAQRSLHNYQAAAKAASKGISCVSCSSANVRKAVKRKLSFSRADALVKQSPEAALLARDVYEELLEDADVQEEVEILTGLGQAYLTLGDVSQATQFCSKALGIDASFASALALQGEISMHEGLFDDAELRFLEALEKGEECALYHFLLGKLYWKMNGNLRADKKKCLASFLKAAKLDPYYSPSFLYLGHYYLKVLKDMSKACRCYQKAFDLDPNSDDAGTALGDSLTELGDEVAALNLYKNITAMSSPGKGKWAWLRLGLFHLKHNESTEAITCFQSALRADPKDRHCWECLGEAYMSRGSFTAAMKAFTKATELDPSSLYCLYQLAAIKQLLSVHGEAIKEYKMILEMQPDYVPALKGLGETYLNQARSAIEQDLNGKAVDCVLEAITVLAQAIKHKPGLSCLWKLLGDCCTIIHPIANEAFRGSIPDTLRKFVRGEPEEFVQKQDMLALGSSAYGKALKLQPECGSLWGDLGFNCFQQAKLLEGSDKEKMAHRSTQALKKGLSLQPSNHKLWNTLGVVAASEEVNNPELSQHCFIMSIKTEPNNVIAWTNLGVLYLKHGKIELAHEAFKNSQALDPSYGAAWTGQATIAEIIASEEAMDLFRHTTELGSHREGNIGYAHWVCSSLLPDKSPENHVILKGHPVPTLSHLHPEYRKAVLQSSTALSKYTDCIRNDAGAYNMYGLILENQKLFLQAEQAFTSAIKLLQQSEKEIDRQHLNSVIINHARVLCALGRYKESAARYQAAKPLNEFHDVCGLALSLFMAGQLKDSFQAYEQAYQQATTDGDRSCVLAALGMLGYALSDMDGAKTMLFKSSQLQPACHQGLMALCTLGLVSGDATLAGAALGELMRANNGNEALTGHICYLYSRFYALQGNQKLGRSHIMKAIHSNPSSSVLWSHLASYLLQACPDELEAAACCSESSARLGGSHSVEHNPAIHPAGIVGSGALRNHDKEAARISATIRTRAGLIASQKAVHAHPDHLSSWSVLAASVTATSIARNRERLERERGILDTRIAQFVQMKASTETDALKRRSENQLPALVNWRISHLESAQSWSVIHHGHGLLFSKMLKEAADHVDQALTVYSSVPHVSTQLHFLKAQVLLASEQPVETGLNMLQASLLSSPVHSPNAWQVLAEVQANQGSAKAAELCYRRCLQAGMDGKSQSWRVVPLIRLALLALRVAQKESPDRDRFLNLALEASSEVVKLKTDFIVAYLIQGIVYFLQNNSGESRRVLERVLDSTWSGLPVAQYWLLLLYLVKKDLSAAQDLLTQARFRGNTRLDLLYYRFTQNGEIPAEFRLRTIEKCVHINPSESVFWNSLKPTA